MESNISWHLIAKKSLEKCGIASISLDYCDIQNQVGNEIPPFKNFDSPLSCIFYNAFDKYFQLSSGYDGPVFIANPEISYVFGDKKYRVDFLISIIHSRTIFFNDCFAFTSSERSLDLCLVELDGFNFHDRNVTQFQYERERQNNLMTMNMPIYRFTYRDMVENTGETMRNLFNRVGQRAFEFIDSCEKKSFDELKSKILDEKNEPTKD